MQICRARLEWRRKDDGVDVLHMILVHDLDRYR